MKNLYLAILLLAFAANLSAFDKVWELQFSSTPHHVHYTEGHKELIVGEGNTFKKYNAETGALIDSVVYSLDALKDYTIGEYHVTDDLKSLYVNCKDSLFTKILKVEIKNFFNIKELLKIDNRQDYETRYLPGNFTQICNDNFVFSFTIQFAILTGYPRTGFTGMVYLIQKDTATLYYNFETNYMQINSYSQSVLISGSYYAPGYRSPDVSNKYYRLFHIKPNMKGGEIPNLNGFTSMNANYIYSTAYSLGNLSRFSFNGIENNKTTKNITSILPYYSDDEMLFYSSGKIYHYNFKVNSYLDSIDLGPNNSYTTDLNNNFLVSINESHITTYKSGANPNKVISYLKDSLLIKSVGDTITLDAFSNLSPIKEEWDLSDGRKISGDTIKFTFPKKGEYLVKYTGTYKDTVVNQICKVKVFDTLALSFTHKVEMKQGYTELTITSEFRGDYDKIIYNPNPTKGKTDLAYVLTDSSLNEVKYKIFTSDIYNFTVSIGNSIKTISKSIELIIPVSNIKNTDYNLVGLKRVINIISHKEDIYFQDYNFSYTTIYPDNQYGPGAYNISVNCLLSTVNNAFQRETKISSNWAAPIGIAQTGIESIAVLKSKNKLYLKNNMLLYCDDLSGKLHIIQDKIESFSNSSIDMNSITYLDIQTYFDKYLFYTYYPNSDPISIGVVNSLYNVSKNDLIGKKYNGKNHDLFCYGSLSVIDTNIYMITHNNNKNIFIYKLNSDFDILDTIAKYPYIRSYSRAINGKHAYSLIDSSTNSKYKQLVTFDIARKKTIASNLDSTINYHQIFQLKNDVSCLVGTKNDELIIQAFKDGETTFTDFVIPINIPFNIIGMTKDNELHLNYTTSGTISSYIRTKGFNDIFKSLASSTPDDSTSNPIDTTKNKGIIQSKDNQFGTVIQDPAFEAAKIYFKDSLDLSYSFVKIYTETGDEILTYYLSKDQKELPIQTDKLYHGTYFVRLFNKGEEHNIGKFIIVR